jgi:hypothetical protein
MFSVGSVTRAYLEISRLYKRSTPTVTLQVVGGDEKRNLESETVKCGFEPEIDCSGEGQQQL